MTTKYLKHFKHLKFFKHLPTISTIVLCTYSLTGCGALAAPCRITSAAIKIIPVVGHAAAIPTDACAAVIDP